MDIKELIFNVAVLFIMMLPGVILKKCKLVTENFGKGISNLVLYIAQPALIVNAYYECSLSFSDIWLNVVYILIFSLIAHSIFTTGAMCLFKKAERDKKKMLRFATLFSNAAFMGIPLIKAIFGPEAAIYASVYNITYNLFLWTLGVYICTRDENEDLDKDGDVDFVDELIAVKRTTKSEVSIIKVLLHPVTIASLIGFTFLIFGINSNEVDLGIVSSSLSMLTGLVAPLSMLVIGLRLADINFNGFINDKHMYLFIALRHFILPLLVIAVLKVASLLFTFPILVGDVIVIMAAAPAASSATMFAEKYDCNAVYVSRLVAVSTILSIVTMPIIVTLFHLI